MDLLMALFAQWQPLTGDPVVLRCSEMIDLIAVLRDTGLGQQSLTLLAGWFAGQEDRLQGCDSVILHKRCVDR